MPLLHVILLLLDINNGFKIAFGMLGINKSVASTKDTDISFQPPITFSLVNIVSMGYSSNTRSVYIHNCIYSNGSISGVAKNDSGGSETITKVQFILVGY